jgi:two-component system, NarL family, sensor histidine kinase UhpB
MRAPWRHGSGWGHEGRLSRTRRPLLTLLLAASIPVLLFAGWIAYRAATDERAMARGSAREAVERVAERVTAEMAVQVQVAETLALSAALDEPDLALFYREAERLKQARPLWFTIELDALDGTQLLNLLRPLGTPLGPTADRDSFEEVLASRRPVIGSIGPTGPVAGRPLLVLRVPVIRGGELRYVLTVAFVPSTLGWILRSAGAPEGWIGAVVDRRGNLIARSVAEEDTAAKPASPALREAIARAPGGFYRGRTLEGVEVETVYKTLPDTGGWSVHLGVPSDLLDRPIRRSLYAVAGGVAASLAVAGVLAGLVSRDIARQREIEGRRAAAALEASEARAALAVEAAELGTWSWDLAQDRLVGSERCRTMLGLPDGPATQPSWPSASFFGAIHRDDRARLREATDRSIRDGVPFTVEFRTCLPEASAPWARVRGRASRSDHQTVLLFGVVADVTGEKHAEEQRLALLRRLAEAQEEVQRRMARELHDQVGQTVTGLSLGLKGLEQALGRDGPAPARDLGERVRWLQGLAQEIGRDLHRVAADLRPASLDDLGLVRALSALGAEWSGRHGIAVDLQMVGDGETRRAPADVEIAVYRTVQEALTNVLKHADARNVSIVLEWRPRELRLVVEDDGRGFDPDLAEPPSPVGQRPRLGLSGMRERLSLLRGRLRIESRPGGGTSLFAAIPLAPENGGAS